MAAPTTVTIISDTSVFHPAAKELKIDEDKRTRYAGPQTIGVLREELLEKTHLVASGKFGPSFYSSAPHPTKITMEGMTTYGWAPGSTHIEHGRNASILVLGAREVTLSDGSKREYVFYQVAQDTTVDSHTFIRTIVPSPLDARVYVISHKTFREQMFDLYPPVATTSGSGVAAVTKEVEFANRFATYTPDQILDRGSIEAQCKRIGQEIFDHYKAAAEGHSDAGIEGMRKVHETVRKTLPNGRLKAECLERAWNRVGDPSATWMA